MAYTEQDWTAILPSATKTKLQAMDAGIKTAQDTLDLETDAGKAMARAANAAAQVALLPDATAAADGKATSEQITKLDGIEAGAEVTSLAKVTAIEVATAEVTAAPAHINVLVAGAKKRLTWAGFVVLVKALFGFVANAVGFEIAGGTTSKKLTVDEDATISTLTANKLAAAIEGGTATATPLDTSIVPGVKADHSRLYYTWANIWAWVIGKFEAGTATATPADTDVVPSISAAHAAQKITWAQIKTALITAFKATAANIVTGTSDLLFVTIKGLKDSLALADMWLTKRTKMPDGATALYSEDNFATVVGFAKYGDYGTIDITTTPGRMRVTRTGVGGAHLQKSVASTVLGKRLLIRYKSTAPVSVQGVDGVTASYMLGSLPSTNGQDAVVLLSYAASYAISMYMLYFYSSSGTVGDYFEMDWYWIGDYSYLPGSISEEAARIADEAGDAPGVGSYASQTITATDLATAGKGDTIYGKKYTFVAALTASPGVEGEILKEATKEAELENENLAISEVSRANNGVKYWAAAVHPTVSSARVNAVLTITSKTKNGTENGITVVCEAGTNHTAGGATLVGGCPDAGAKYSGLVAMGSKNLTAKTSLVAGDYLTLLDSVVGFLKKKILVSNFFAADGGTGAFTAVQANDSRLPVRGTFTPQLRFGEIATGITGTFTGYFQCSFGDYHCWGRVTLTSKGTTVGLASIDIPVTAGATNQSIGNFIADNGTQMASLGDGWGIFLQIPASAALANIKRMDVDGTTGLTNANFLDTTDFRFDFHFIV